MELIKENREFRRTDLVEKIKSQLESQRRLLIVGESGFSKTTILMEIICDYFDNGYRILYSITGTETIKGEELAQAIEDLLCAKNKVLVAVDNAHDVKTAGIFYVMDRLSSFTLKDNVRFLITVTIPDFYLFVNERSREVGQAYRDSVRSR